MCTACYSTQNAENKMLKIQSGGSGRADAVRQSSLSYAVVYRSERGFLSVTL